MRAHLTVLLGLYNAQLVAAPSILNATAHADTFIAPAVNAVLGTGKVDNPIFIDYDPSGSVVADSSNGAGVFFSVASGLSSNHVTYAALNESICCYSPGLDQMYYTTLVSQGTVLAQPVVVAGVGPLPVGSQPGTVIVSASAPNSSNGGTGWGVEFGLPTSYLSLDTSKDSFVSAEMSGFLAALKYNHPTWNWFDIKGALRITANQWSTGYTSTGFGFGLIDWTAANAVASPTAVYLQGPGLNVQNNGYYALITLYPYRQTRRSVELLYSVAASYVWPVKNEYTATDITTSGATLLYTSNGTDITPHYSFTPLFAGTATFVAFTSDGAGHFSRIEPFSAQSVTLTTGTSCHQ
jgi:hypothetical protein